MCNISISVNSIHSITYNVQLVHYNSNTSLLHVINLFGLGNWDHDHHQPINGINIRHSRFTTTNYKVVQTLQTRRHADT